MLWAYFQFYTLTQKNTFQTPRLKYIIYSIIAKVLDFVRKSEIKQNKGDDKNEKTV